MKPTVGWMVKGPSGIAPFYGFGFTRKELMNRLERKEYKLLPSQEVVKVEIMLWRDKWKQLGTEQKT